MEPKVYLDMDGLLANLFDTLGHKFYNQDYKNLTRKQKTDIKIIWTNKKEFNKHFGSVKDLFANLEPFGKNGEITQAIIEATVNVFGEYCILSHPASINKEECIAGKKEWIQKHLNPLPKQAIFPQNKAQYAISSGVVNILVDDFPAYIQGWADRGGYPIQMRTDGFTSAMEASMFITQKLQKAKEELVKESAFTKLVMRILTE